MAMWEITITRAMPSPPSFVTVVGQSPWGGNFGFETQRRFNGPVILLVEGEALAHAQAV